MKRTIALLLFCTVFRPGFAQDNPPLAGTVSFITSQNIYVKFSSTEGIKAGDTLFVSRGDSRIPALVVREISSISVVCERISENPFKVGDAVVSTRTASAAPVVKPSSGTVPAPSPPIPLPDTNRRKRPVPGGKPAPFVRGRAGVTSYLSLPGYSDPSVRMKYQLSFIAGNIGGSGFTTEADMTFSHRSGQWDAIRSDLFNGLKIYTLAANYHSGKHDIWIGRKINPRLPGTGPVDGLQYEFRPGAFSAGVFAGLRPDPATFGFNGDLVQFGAFAGHELRGRQVSTQTVLAFAGQLCRGLTDRRFASLQHSTSLGTTLYFYGSAEADFYRLSRNTSDTATIDTAYTTLLNPVLSNLYLSLRYRPFRRFSVSVSYSERKPVIYYESYRSWLDRLLEQAAVQGIGVQVHYQPANRMTLGVNASYRDSKTDLKSSKNIYGFFTWTDLASSGLSATASATLLETGYMTGGIYGMALNKDLAGGKLSTGLTYRHVRYRLTQSSTKFPQHVAELNLQWRILKKLSCSAFYEGTFDRNAVFHRVILQLTQRF